MRWLDDVNESVSAQIAAKKLTRLAALRMVQAGGCATGCDEATFGETTPGLSR